MSKEPQASWVYPVGVLGYLMIISTLLLALFLTNLGTGDEAEFYENLGIFYALMGVLTIAVVGSTVIYTDPRKSASDISAFLFCFAPFLMILLISPGLSYRGIVLVSLPLPIIHLLVATAEEGAFRVALPRVFYQAGGGDPTMRWIFAGILSTLLFALFHAWAYDLETKKLVSAFVFGSLQYVTFRIGVLISGDGATVLPGIIGSHWLLNLYFLGEDWVLWGFWYTFGIILILVAARGYPLTIKLSDWNFPKIRW